MNKKVAVIINSVSTKVIVIIIILVLPLNIIALSEASASINTTLDQVRMTEQNMADIYMANMSMRMKNANSLLFYFISEDSNCIRMIQQRETGYSYKSAKLKFYTSLRRLADMTDGADGYFYYMRRIDDFLVYGTSAEVSRIRSQLKETVSVEPKDKSEKRWGWHIYEWENCQYLVYFFSKNDVTYGAWMNLGKLSEEIFSGIDYERVGVNYSENSEIAKNKNMISVRASLNNIYLHISLDKREILEGISIYQRILQFMVAVYLIAIPVLYVFLRYLLLTPLSRINFAHRQIQNGNQNYRIKDKGNSREYGEAYQSFNLMADRLHSYRIDAYEKEIARQKMELRNLQLQIRPHFLLNTFNLIYTLVQRKDNDSVQDIIIYLSDYFRYIFRSEKEMELFPKEMEVIRGYIKLASIRYKDMIEADFDLDPEIEFVRMPPLLIHNFVENAVKYGIKEGEVLHISLRGEYDNKMVTFYIIDDGNGMDEETLEKNRRILRGELELENQNSHMGLFNSYKRLRYFYGENTKIEVESELGVMTSFMIQFPYSVEVEDESFTGE
ncbi:sensor histidine kinase [Eisenbergiella tayi]|uniref:sensor histidine kinase n=1 Tax=Eisenbergiella tayi TaxID=1432052 RepID=UPI000848AAFD|nr:histidine kinase [Eisenbergiella tayi]ODR33745.1 hypothetical protein BEI60_22835 [Eisenbergiella tayi]